MLVNSYMPAVIYNCISLNLRKKPTFSSEVIGVYESGTKIYILSSRKDEDFAEVETPDKKKGYMCKRYLRNINWKDERRETI